mmetsp:Transcript_87228/g.137690  ORF Transcript_87228/g.137690 Transcript_87228/m.137690 type:complete len:95 (+) Transcript_87228:577-861(+)
MGQGRLKLSVSHSNSCHGKGKNSSILSCKLMRKMDYLVWIYDLHGIGNILLMMVGALETFVHHCTAQPSRQHRPSPAKRATSALPFNDIKNSSC